MPRGRKPTTGRYETREELVDVVLFLYFKTSCSIERVAKHCGISQMTASKIISTRK